MALGGNGWLFLAGARKAHWIKQEDGRSLCGKWLYLGSHTGRPTLLPGKNDYGCVACTRALAAKEKTT